MSSEVREIDPTDDVSSHKKILEKPSEFILYVTSYFFGFS